MNHLPSFEEFFHALWGFEPFPWQTMLAKQVARGCWPDVLDLPTAAGKTACIDIALFALACQAKQPIEQRSTPRRIWFVVDRRIVVDEAFERATTIANKLQSATSGPLFSIANELRDLAGTDRAVAVARLRGGILRDDGWARLPSQPAVITSTVDQLGSQLLFRSYGHSQRTAPIFAGLAANDSLIILDEAHCSVPFAETVQAIEQYRSRPWAEDPLPTPFKFLLISATPPHGLSDITIFPGPDRHQALDHPQLHQRLRAHKYSELVPLKPTNNEPTDPVVTEATRRAQQFIQSGRKRVAVIVNRVATAYQIADQLERQPEHADGKYQVLLLTGRLRSFERDALIQHWKPFLKASEPEPLPTPVIVVATQCLEVGADFSFDALVTEAASLDALRQRFGRLDRMGTYETSHAAILIRHRDIDPKKASPDPVYGNAIAHTWELLTKHSRDNNIDFGVNALSNTIANVTGEDLDPCITPSKHAPVLLPAHLDLLCQTAPVPHPDPDVHQYLHGVGKRIPEVQVIWRADLNPDDPQKNTTWVETIALCRPVTGELLSLPRWLVVQWLRNQQISDNNSTDVEGIAEPTDNAKDPSSSSQDFQRSTRPFVLWRGRRSIVSASPDDISPGDIVVVPAAYGMNGLARPSHTDALGTEQLDLWERALSTTSRPIAVRIHRSVLAPWTQCEPVRQLIELAEAPIFERQQLDEAIQAVLNYSLSSHDQPEQPSPPPPWWLELLQQAATGRAERHPTGGIVLFARTPYASNKLSPAPDEPDFFADDDDLTCLADTEQSLDEHSTLVRDTVQKLAKHCLPDHLHAPLSNAAYWHDVGKLDPRFQVFLHHGDELAAVASQKPLAKSSHVQTTPAQRRILRESCGLPENFRHEMLSTQLANKFVDKYCTHLDEVQKDLFLHLIASHHGHARPLAPVCEDLDPPEIQGTLGDLTLYLSTNDRNSWIAHRLDSGLSDRFWRLVRRYGWWGLAYLEAILRLGDWYASRLRMQHNHQKDSAP